MLYDLYSGGNSPLLLSDNANKGAQALRLD